MEKYLHKIAGIYTSQSVAEGTRNHLIERGFLLEQINILLPKESSADNKIEPEGNEVRRFQAPSAKSAA